MMQEYHAPQPQPEPQSGVRLPTTTLLDAVVPAVCFLLTWGLFSSILTFGGPSAWTAVCYAGLFALATVYLAAKQRHFRPAALLPGLCALAVCSGFLLHNDSSDFTLLAFLLLIPLSGFCCLSLTGANLHPFGSFYVLLDLLHCELFLPLKHLLLPLRALSENRRTKKKNRGVPVKRRILLPVLLGVLVALPLLFWAVSLLIDADAAFESVLGTAFDALHRFAEAIVNRLPDYFEPFALFLAVLFTPYIFSVMFCFAHGVAGRENRDTSGRWAGLQKLSPAFVITVLSVLSAAYVLYLLTQAGYLFAAWRPQLRVDCAVRRCHKAQQRQASRAGQSAGHLPLRLHHAVVRRFHGKDSALYRRIRADRKTAVCLYGGHRAAAVLRRSAAASVDPKISLSAGHAGGGLREYGAALCVRREQHDRVV